MDHADTMRRIYDLINAGDIDGFGALIAADFVEHEQRPASSRQGRGPRVLPDVQAAFPDMRMQAEDVIASGDKAVVRVRDTGTHQGAFMGMPATGKNVDVQLIDIMRMGADGLCREHWGVMDQLKMMQQLGVVPEGPPA